MTYPITLDEFKAFFQHEAGIQYQSYQPWEPHGYPAGIYVSIEVEGGGVFRALTDYNCADPMTSPTKWEQVVGPGERGRRYGAGEFIYDTLGKAPALGYYMATEDGATIEEPKVWEPATLIDIAKAFEVEAIEEWRQPDGYVRGDLILYYMNYKPYVFECVVAATGEPPAVPNPNAKVVTYGDWVINEEATAELGDEILDADIERAMGEAAFKFNENLFTEEKGRMVFLYLTMFFLVYDRQMAASGINGNSAAGPVVSRTVGKMSVSYMESKLFKNYPSYEFLSTNDYGRKAFNLMMPYLRGNVRILWGGSTGE